MTHGRIRGRYVSKALGHHNRGQSGATRLRTRSGSAFQVAIRAALENGHDVLIKTIAIEGSESRATQGSVGRTGIPSFFIGSTAERVFDEVSCSVLALKPHGFASPVTLEPKGSRATSST